MAFITTRIDYFTLVYYWAKGQIFNLKRKQELQEVLSFQLRYFGIQKTEILNKIFQISIQFVLWKPEPKNTELSNKMI